MISEMIPGHQVLAELDSGSREELDVSAYDTETGDIYVAWPLADGAMSSANSARVPGRTRVSADKYEPLDKKSWEEMVRHLDPDKSEKY